jgi:uncharacterized protein YukE
MIPDGYTNPLFVSTVTVTPDPDLMAADPGLMRTAAGQLMDSAHRVDSVAKGVRSGGHEILTTWKGKAATAFSSSMSDLDWYGPAAAESLAGASAALGTLAGQIEQAQELARQAEALAHQANTGAEALLQSYYQASTQRVGALPSSATASEVAAARAPTSGEMSVADGVSSDGARAMTLMDEANRQARQAWALAAATFDEVTSAAPSVVLAGIDARVKVFNKSMISQGTAVLFMFEAAAASGLPGSYDGEEEGFDPALSEEALGDPSLVANLEAEEKLSVDGQELGPAVAADMEGGLKIGWSDTTSVEQAYEEMLLNSDTADLMPAEGPYGGLGPADYQDRYLDKTAKTPYGSGNWAYPPDRGADPVQPVEPDLPIHPGDTIDRFGPETGTFVSPEGTPWADRSLPATSLLPASNGASPYHSYVFTDQWASGGSSQYRVQASVVAPAFNQPGGGIQMEFVDRTTGESVPVGTLVQQGYLKPTSP